MVVSRGLWSRLTAESLAGSERRVAGGGTPRHRVGFVPSRQVLHLRCSGLRSGSLA